ncbi:hypothetical protein MRX96_019499 [Rhipicephalus microplus]
MQRRRQVRPAEARRIIVKSRARGRGTQSHESRGRDAAGKRRRRRRRTRLPVDGVGFAENFRSTLSDHIHASLLFRYGKQRSEW